MGEDTSVEQRGMTFDEVTVKQGDCIVFISPESRIRMSPDTFRKIISHYAYLVYRGSPDTITRPEDSVTTEWDNEVPWE